MGDRVVRFLEEARDELIDAVDFYNRRTVGAGERLLDDVLATVDRISEAPTRWPIEPDGYRRCMLLIFPYSLCYGVNNDGNIDIVAVAHGKRRPGYFRGRNP